MSVRKVSTTLLIFKTKIEEAVTLVPEMGAEEKLKAVEFWNAVSEKLQEIVNNSAADISALALRMEKQEEERVEKLLEEQQKSAQNKMAAAYSTPTVPVAKQRDDLSVEQAKKLVQAAAQEAETFLPQTTNFATAPAPNFPVASSLGGQAQAFENQAPSAVVSDPPLDYISNPPQHPPTACQTAVHPGIDTFAATQREIEGVIKNNLSSLSLDSLSDGTGAAEASIANENRIVMSALQQEIPSSILETLLLDPREKENGLNADIAARQKRLPPSKKTTPIGSPPKTNPAVQQHPVIPPNNQILDPSPPVVDNNESEAQDSQDDDDDDDDDDEEDDDCDRLDEPSSLEAPGGPNENRDFDGENDGKENDNGTKTVIVRLETKAGEKVIIPKKSKKGKGSLTCEWCFKQFTNSSALTSHRWVHTKPYTCNECDACFSTRGNLVVHQRRHTGEKPFGCTLCDARFSTKGNLKRHTKTHSGAKPWVCSQCGGRFTEKKSLKVHMRRHTGEKPYQCRICGKRFSQTGILQTHMAMHLDQKSYLCEHCGKSFRQKSQLRLHMMRHTGVRNHVCSSCPARFLTKGDLERHNRIHTGERPFTCDLCGKTFTRQQSLNEHMNRHYGLKPYNCKYCGKVFAEMSACYKHAKQHERGKKSQSSNAQATLPDQLVAAITVPNSNSNSNSLQLTSATDDVADQIVEVPHADFGDVDPNKFTILVHTTSHQPLEVAGEMTVVHDQPDEEIVPDKQQEHITVAVPNHISDFTTISMLASASAYQ